MSGSAVRRNATLAVEWLGLGLLVLLVAMVVGSGASDAAQPLPTHERPDLVLAARPRTSTTPGPQRGLPIPGGQAPASEPKDKR